MQSSLISVIIPTYKPQNYFNTCLSSLQCQTLDKGMFEVVIVLNGCDEPWHSQVKGLIKDFLSDLDVRLIQTDTPGVSNARNIGIDNAKGEYITFIDDDDYLSPQFLQRMLEQASPDTVVLTDSRAFRDGKKGWIDTFTPHVAYVNYSSTKDQNLFRVRAIFNGPCMKLLHRSFMLGEAFDTRLTNGEDGLFMFQISRYFAKIAYAEPDAIYYRRYREGSAASTKKPILFWLKVASRIEGAYIKSWLKHPLSYNFPFFISRVLATFKSLLINIKN